MSWKWAGEPGQGYSRLYKIVVPYWLRRRGGPRRYIQEIPSRMQSFVWRAYHRTANRMMDLEAKLQGFCNERSYDPEEIRGGYAHWRCGRRDGHCGAHRHNNYVWGVRGEVEYRPWPIGIEVRCPRQPRERHCIYPSRDSRRLGRNIRRAWKATEVSTR
jgi:hypothetical protein